MTFSPLHIAVFYCLVPHQIHHVSRDKKKTCTTWHCCSNTKALNIEVAVTLWLQCEVKGGLTIKLLQTT